MKHVVIDRPGGYERLEVRSAPDLVPGPKQVVIEVAAAGVNYADCIVRMGYYESARELVGYPLTPGFEFAGRISKLGSGVRSLKVGEDVFGVSFFGAYATQVCVPEGQVFPLPARLSLIQAATLPTAFLTAWYAATKLAPLGEGMTVLIHSAAGGVGSALTQIASLKKCSPVGVVGSASKVGLAREMGCTAVIDKSSEPLWPRAEEYAKNGYDVVFDATGVETLAGSYRHLAPMGRLVTYGSHSMLPKTGGRPNTLKLAWAYLRTPRFNPIRMAEANKSVMGFNLSFLFGKRELLEEGMSQLLGWVNGGLIRPLPVKEYRFEDVVRAHRDIESGSTIGKLALVLNSERQVVR